MQGRPIPKPLERRPWLFGLATILAILWGTESLWSQTPPLSASSNSGPSISGSDQPAAGPTLEGGVLQAGCSTCGSGLLGKSTQGSWGTSCSSGRCDSGCVPGRLPCESGCHADTFCGRIFDGIIECLCCPDPCYDPPHWLAVADAAFFADAARPVTQQRIRIDSGWNFTHPDRAEHFWARQKKGKGPNFIADSIDFEELSMYTEAAAGRAGVFVEVPYREVEGDLMDPGKSGFSQSGFADMKVGTKSLLIDCELLQLTFQFTTYIPTATAGKGLGTGHVSLEPSLILAVRLAPETYLQYQTAYWIPVGGDPVFQGDIWRNHWSFNHVLWQPGRNFQLIGTAEFNLWAVLGGYFTESDTVNRSARTAIFSLGPGIRGVICDKIDVGVGSAFSLSGPHWAEEMVRVDIRWRF